MKLRQTKIPKYLLLRHAFPTTVGSDRVYDLEDYKSCYQVIPAKP